MYHEQQSSASTSNQHKIRCKFSNSEMIIATIQLPHQNIAGLYSSFYKCKTAIWNQNNHVQYTLIYQYQCANLSPYSHYKSISSYIYKSSQMMLENIEQVNQDLQIRNSYLQQNSNIVPVSEKSLFTADRLMQALRKRNEYYDKNYDTRAKPTIAQPLRQLSQRAAKQARLINYEQQQKTKSNQMAREWHSEVPWDNFTYANQEKYADEHHEYLIQHIIGKSFTNLPAINKATTATLINTLKGFKQNELQSPSRLHSKLRIEANMTSNRMKYMNFIKRHAMSGNPCISNISELKYLDGENTQIWQIMSEYVSAYSYAVKHQKINPHIAIVNSAIAFVQNKFKQQLPSLDNEKDLSEFMRKRYVMNSRQYKYQSNVDGILTWAVSYALYRAGCWSNFMVSLNDKGAEGAILRQQLTKFQESVNSLDPTAQYFTQSRINDVFYSQLVSIAKGVSQYDETLSRIGSLDFVWLVLKTIKIYQQLKQQKSIQFEQITQALLNYHLLHQDRPSSFSTSMSKSQQQLMPYMQFLYLGAYTSFIAYRNKIMHSHPTTIMTIDDYFHVLLILYHNPHLMIIQNAQKQRNNSTSIFMTPRKQKQNIDQWSTLLNALQSTFIDYLSEIIRITQCKQYVLYYIIQIPSQIFSNAIYSVFNTWELFNSVNQSMVNGQKGWKFIKFRYQYDRQTEHQAHLFEQSILRLFYNLLSLQQSSQVHIKLVQSASQLLTSAQNYLNFVLKCQCNHLLKLTATYSANLNETQPIFGTSLSFDNKNNNTNNTNVKNDKKQQIVIYRRLNNILHETIQNYPQLQQNYGTIIQFLDQYCLLQDLTLQKQTHKLQRYLRDQQFIRDMPMLIQQNNNQMKDMLQKLEQFNALELFYRYLKNVVFNYEKVSFIKRSHDKAKNYKQSIKKIIQKLKAAKKYRINEFQKYTEF